MSQKTLRIDVEDWVWRRLKAIAADSGTTLGKLIAQEISGLAMANPPVVGPGHQRQEARSWPEVREMLGLDDPVVASEAARAAFAKRQLGIEAEQAEAVAAQQDKAFTERLGQEIGDDRPAKRHKFVPRSDAKPMLCKTCGKHKEDHS